MGKKVGGPSLFCGKMEQRTWIKNFSKLTISLYIFLPVSENYERLRAFFSVNYCY